MKRVFFIIVLILALSSLLFSESPIKKAVPSWLFSNKRFSMNHSFSFLYSSRGGSFSSLYNNYFIYRISPKLSLIGNIGYFSRGMKTHSSGSMLQGFGFEYKPSSNLLLHFQYEGLEPVNKTGKRSGKRE